MLKNAIAYILRKRNRTKWWRKQRRKYRKTREKISKEKNYNRNKKINNQRN